MTEENVSVAEVTQRLREIEDHNIALRLQEEEFLEHYNRNRQDRRLVGDDTKRSIREQMNEDQVARQRRLEANKKIAESDEELARRLQREFEEESRREQEEQARRDAELAKRLAFVDQPHAGSSSRVGVPMAEPSHALEQSPTAVNDQPLIDLTPDERSTTLITNTPTPPLTDDIFTSPPPPPPTVLTHNTDHDGYENVQMDLSSPGCSTSAVMESVQIPALVNVLHPTNPFLQDIAPQGTIQQTSQQQQQFHSEFGLPPPSDLALGKRD